MSDDDVKKRKPKKTPSGEKKGSSGRHAADARSAAREDRARKGPSEKRRLHDMAMDEIFEASPWASGVVERKRPWPGPRYTRLVPSVVAGSSVMKVLAQSSEFGARKTIEALQIKVSVEESRSRTGPEFFNPWAESGLSTESPPVAKTTAPKPDIRRARGPEYRLAPEPAPWPEARAEFKPTPPRPPADVARSTPWIAPPAGERKPEPAPEAPQAPIALASEFVNPWVGPAEAAGEPKAEPKPELPPASVPPAPEFVNPWLGPSAPAGEVRPEPRPAPPRPPIPAVPGSASPWTEATIPAAGVSAPAAPEPRPAPGSASPWTEATVPAAGVSTPVAPAAASGPELPPRIQPAPAPTPWTRPPESGRDGGVDQGAAAGGESVRPGQPAATEKTTTISGWPAKQAVPYEEILVENLFNGIFHVLGDGVDMAVDTGKSAFTKLACPARRDVPPGEAPVECAANGIVRAVGDGLGEAVNKGKSVGAAIISRIQAGARGFSLAGFGLVCGIAGLITGRMIGKKIGL